MVDVREKRLRGNETTQNESTNNEEALGTDSIHSIDSSSEINTSESSSSDESLRTNTSCHTLSSLASTRAGSLASRAGSFARAGSEKSLDMIHMNTEKDYIGLNKITITLACGHPIDITAPLRVKKCPECDKKIPKKTQKKISAIQKANAMQDL